MRRSFIGPGDQIINLDNVELIEKDGSRLDFTFTSGRIKHFKYGSEDDASKAKWRAHEILNNEDDLPQGG